MGGFSCRRSPCLAGAEMTRVFRLSLYLFVGFLLGACASLSFAASYGSTTNKGFPGGAWKGTGTISGTTPQTIESINVGGKYVAVPMLGSLGAAALEAAIIGLKNAPKTVGGPLALAWLANKGIQLIGDEWKKEGAPVEPIHNINGRCDPSGVPGATWPAYDTDLENCKSRIKTTWEAWLNNGKTVTFTGFLNTSTSMMWDRSDGYKYIIGQFGNRVESAKCPTNYELRDGACFPTDYVPVGESDWEQVYGNTPPAQVLQELCSRLQSGCNAAPVTTQPVTSPLSDWKTDPVTGVQTRQTVKITPAPTPENPERVQVDITVETKTTTTTTNPETGETSTAEQTSAESDKNPDFCALHPDSLACWEAGDPDGSDLEKKELGASITPVLIGGSGSCPPDKHVNYMGADLAISFEPICKAAGWINPIVLALAWLSAGYILIGAFRE